MKKNLTNDQKYKNYQIRKVLRIIIMILFLLMIILCFFSLFNQLSFLYPLGIFLIATLLVKYRDSLEFIETKPKEKKKS